MPVRKSDMNELKRRYTKRKCSVDVLCGCYVDAKKNILFQFRERFYNLPDSAMLKYMALAKKVVGNTPGKNSVELHFAKSKSKQQDLLQSVKSGKLMDDDSLSSLYASIIEWHESEDQYIILLFHDVYDVPVKTSDRIRTGESEEVYEYIVCAICPVTLTKEGLVYNEDTYQFEPCERARMIGAPEHGFVYPAFSDRSTDTTGVVYYVKGKETETKLIEKALGCKPKRISAEDVSVLQDILVMACDNPDQVMRDIQTQAKRYVTPETVDTDTLTKEEFIEIISEIPSIQPEEKEPLLDAYSRVFNTDALKITAVASASEKDVPEEPAFDTPPLQDEPMEGALKNNANIYLSVSAQKEREIYLDEHKGKRCLVIPIGEKDAASINGTPLSM